MAQRGTDFDDVRTNSRSDKPKITDKITQFKFPEKKWVTLRVWGPTFSYATGWVKTKTKDGKPTKFPVSFPSYDPDTQQFDTTKYDPWYAIVQEESDIKENDKRTVQVSRKFYCNAISRAAQKQQPSRMPKATAGERKSGFKDKDSETWTPWVALALPGGAINKIKELKPLNVVSSKKTGASTAYSMNHEKFGCDIRVMYDSSKAPADQYSVQIGERVALTEEELAFLKWDLSDLATESTEEETRRDYESWAKRMGIKTKGKSRKQAAEDDYEDNEELDEEDEDEDDEPAPRKGSKKAPAKKAAPAKGKKKAPVDDEDEEDDDFDDEDEEDEDEDEPAPKKGKAKPAPKKGKKAVDEDEDDEDDFGDDDEEDEDSDDEDEEEDDDLDEDEDDEDDEPAPKRGAKKAPAKKPVAKGKRKPVDEDEDEDDDLDDEDEEEEDDDFDDEDEEDAPPPKKGKAKPAAKKAPVKGKGKRVVEEDEDDEDEDEDDDDFDDEDEDEDEAPPPKKKAPAKKVVKKVRR